MFRTVPNCGFLRYWRRGFVCATEIVQSCGTPTFVVKREIGERKNHLIIILLDNYIGPQTINHFVCAFEPSPSAHDRFWHFFSFFFLGLNEFFKRSDAHSQYQGFVVRGSSWELFIGIITGFLKKEWYRNVGQSTKMHLLQNDLFLPENGRACNNLWSHWWNDFSFLMQKISLCPIRQIIKL